MEAVAHQVGTLVRVKEKQDPNDGRVGRVIERGTWGSVKVTHCTLVRFEEGICRTRWYRDSNLLEVKDEGE